MLRCEGLRLDRGTFTLTADLALERGGLVSVMGPSGAGKSTLLSAIGGFLDPARGQILWGKTDITHLPPAKRPVSTVFQAHNLFPHMTVQQNAALGLTLNRKLTPPQRDSVAMALDRVGLAGFEDRRPDALSGGQQSRVALARVLLMSNPVLCLDEPFSALGPAMKAEMIDLVRDVAQGLSALVLLVTHDPAEALHLGGQTVVVAEGMAHPPEATEGLLRDPPPALRAYLGSNTS